MKQTQCKRFSVCWLFRKWESPLLWFVICDDISIMHRLYIILNDSIHLEKIRTQKTRVVFQQCTRPLTTQILLEWSFVLGTSFYWLRNCPNFFSWSKRWIFWDVASPSCPGCCTMPPMIISSGWDLGFLARKIPTGYTVRYICIYIYIRY